MDLGVIGALAGPGSAPEGSRTLLICFSRSAVDSWGCWSCSGAAVEGWADGCMCGSGGGWPEAPAAAALWVGAAGEGVWLLGLGRSLKAGLLEGSAGSCWGMLAAARALLARVPGVWRPAGSADAGRCSGALGSGLALVRWGLALRVAGPGAAELGLRSLEGPGGPAAASLGPGLWVVAAVCLMAELGRVRVALGAASLSETCTARCLCCLGWGLGCPLLCVSPRMAGSDRPGLADSAAEGAELGGAA